MGKKKGLTPKFKSEVKEAEYWDTHSPLDLGAEPKTQKVRVRGTKDRPITIRLDSETRQKLNELAERRGVGPSTLVRSLLVSAIEQRGDLPVMSFDGLRDLLNRNLPREIKDQAEHLANAISIGAPDNPDFLLLDKSQMNEWGELGLQIISILFAISGVQVVTPEHTKCKEVKTPVESGA